MKSHKFTPIGKIKGKEVFVITCEETGGQFSSRMWERFPKDLCLICGEMIKEKNNGKV